MRLRSSDDVAPSIHVAQRAKKLEAECVVITRGEQGMSLFQAGGEPVHLPTVAREVFDVTGAGDTVIATSTLALACGAGYEQAALLANYAGGLVLRFSTKSDPEDAQLRVERRGRNGACVRRFVRIAEAEQARSLVET